MGASQSSQRLAGHWREAAEVVAGSELEWQVAKGGSLAVPYLFIFATHDVNVGRETSCVCLLPRYRLTMQTQGTSGLA